MITNYLKKYFNEKGITQFEIEKKTGIKQSKLSLTLNGKRKLSADELLKIANVYEINLEKIKKEN